MLKQGGNSKKPEPLDVAGQKAIDIAVMYRSNESASILRGAPLPHLIYSTNVNTNKRGHTTSTKTLLGTNNNPTEDAEECSINDSESEGEEEASVSTREMLIVLEDVENDFAEKWKPSHPSKELPPVSPEMFKKAEKMREDTRIELNQKREQRILSDFPAPASPTPVTFQTKREKRRSLELSFTGASSTPPNNTKC